jgi:hypothetical protein
MYAQIKAVLTDAIERYLERAYILSLGGGGWGTAD